MWSCFDFYERAFAYLILEFRFCLFGGYNKFQEAPRHFRVVYESRSICQVPFLPPYCEQFYVHLPVGTCRVMGKGGLVAQLHSKN